MKRYGNLWSKICDYENLKLAHQKAKEDKTFYKEVKMVDSDEDYYLHEIQKMLINKSYKVIPEDYEISTIQDREKERELWKLRYYPHRIIQWAIMLQIEHIFMKTFCDHTCASIKDKGGRHVNKLIHKYLKDTKHAQYCLKIDIKKFYPNINHEVLKKLIRKKFKDKDLLEIMDMIIDSYAGDVGVPIGSYLSQFLANFYLCYFDHFLKETLRVKMVIRYMDDIIIIGPNKAYLHYILGQMRNYLNGILKLTIKHNWAIFPIAIRGIDFVGYRYFGAYTLLRKRTCIQFKKKAVRILQKQLKNQLINYSEWCSMNSYIGWLSWCNSWRLSEKYLVPIFPSLIRYYRTVIQKGKSEKVKDNRVRKYIQKLNKARIPKVAA